MKDYFKGQRDEAVANGDEVRAIYFQWRMDHKVGEWNAELLRQAGYRFRDNHAENAAIRFKDYYTGD